MAEKREHLYYIDILRILSCIAVVGAHAHLEFVSRAYWSVLVFTTISGALMLTRDNIDIKKLYTKSIARIVRAFLIWSVLYAVVSHVLMPLFDGEPVRLKLMVTSIVEGHYHLWYCYMLVGLYIITPGIKAVINVSEKLVFYMLTVMFIFSLLIPSMQNLSILQWTRATTEQIGLNGFRFIFYYILGYYLITHDFTGKELKGVYFGGIPAILLYLFIPGSFFMETLEAAVVIWLFVVARYNIRIKNERMRTIVRTLGDSVFTVYLAHDMFHMMFARLFNEATLPGYDIKKFIFTVVLSFSFGVLVTVINRKKAYGRIKNEA